MHVGMFNSLICNFITIMPHQFCAKKKYCEKIFGTCRIFIIFIIINCVYFQVENAFWKEDGDMLTPRMRPNLQKNPKIWMPKMCSMHEYNIKEFKKCWRNRKPTPQITSLYFIGDSHEKRLFSRFTTQFYSDLSCNSTKPEVFASNYCLNNVNRLSIVYQHMPTIDNSIKELFISWEERLFVPDFIMMGCSLHPILNSNGSNSYRHEFRKNLTGFLPFLDRLARKTSFLWYVQPPVIDETMKQKHIVITNEKVNFYNEIATEILSRTRVILWTSAREIAIDNRSSYADSVHVGDNASNYFMQILTNFWCNHRFSYKDGTCSKRIGPNGDLISYGHYFIASQVIVVLLAIFFMEHFGSHFFSKSLPSNDILPSQQNESTEYNAATKEHTPYWKRFLIKLCVITKVSFFFGYVYICEGVPIFMKDPFKVSPLFMVGSLIMTIILVFYSYEKFNEDVGILKRQLIDETKGVAIFVLLFLKLNKFSNNQIIIPEHLTESAFIMLNGIEISCYYLSTKPMNICHFLQELYNQNVLVVVLCLILRHSIIHYEIFPVMFVCFSAAYIVFALPPRPVMITLENEEIPINAWKVISVHSLKILILGGAFGYFHNSMKLEAQIFNFPLWRSIFATKEDTLDPWLLRWHLDKFCFLYGVIGGFAFELRHLLCKVRILQFPQSKIISKGLVTTTGILFAYKFYLGLEVVSLSQQDNNSYYVLFGDLAVIYILLRSCLVSNCSYYSKILATLGRFWREIYLLHFHIWMAFDGNAFLVLLPFSSLINLCCITFILIYISYDIRDSISLFDN